MQNMTISMLKPEIGRVPYYDTFYRNYSMLVATSLVTYEIINETPEAEIFELICGTSSFAASDHERLRVDYIGIGVDFRTPQTNEARGLDRNALIEPIKAQQISATNSLITFINASEFLFLFAIFEAAIKDAVSSGKDFPEKAVMSQILAKLKKDGTFDQFRNVLAKRTLIQNFKDAEEVWKFFLDFRHLYVHGGGRVTEKWLGKFQTSMDGLMSRLTKDTDLAKMFLADVIESCQPQDGQLFVVTDNFTNVFRNFIVSIMEALYLTEIRHRPAHTTDSSG